MRRRQTTFFEREQNILATAEQLLLESGNGDIKLDELASQLDIAKGTLYKHIASKDELYLKILIRYEKSLADINAIKDDRPPRLPAWCYNYCYAPSVPCCLIN